MKKIDWDNIIDFTRNSYRIFFDRNETYQDIGITNFITSNLHKYDLKYFYSGENIIFEKNDVIKKEIKKILSSFKNHKIIVYTKNYSKWENIDKYYNMKYSIEDYPSNLPDEKLTKLNYVIPEISEPKVKNKKFI